MPHHCTRILQFIQGNFYIPKEFRNGILLHMAASAAAQALHSLGGGNTVTGAVAAAAAAAHAAHQLASNAAINGGHQMVLPLLHKLYPCGVHMAALGSPLHALVHPPGVRKQQRH
jgi:hypothetical protein